MSGNDAKSGTPPADRGGDGNEGAASGESRREFIKKLPYVAPVIQSFFLRDTVYGDDDDDDGGRGRGRGRVSKVKKEKKDKGKTAAPPPPPPAASSGR